MKKWRAVIFLKVIEDVKNFKFFVAIIETTRNDIWYVIERCIKILLICKDINNLLLRKNNNHRLTRCYVNICRWLLFKELNNLWKNLQEIFCNSQIMLIGHLSICQNLFDILSFQWCKNQPFCTKSLQWEDVISFGHFITLQKMLNCIALFVRYQQFEKLQNTVGKSRWSLSNMQKKRWSV